MIQVSPSMTAAIADGNYVIVPAGKMPSPSEPGQEVEVWLIQPNGVEMPVPIGSGSEREPAVVGR